MARKDTADKIRVVQSGRRAKRERSFEQLYRESYELVYNYVSYRMAGAEGVEDVVSEAFLKAARAFDRFDPARAKFSTWVITIAINCMNSHYRSYRPTVDIGSVQESAFAQSGEQDDVENRQFVLLLLQSLTEEERALVFMKYYQGMRNADIAVELDMKASTVSTKLSRAMAKMRAVAERGD